MLLTYPGIFPLLLPAVLDPMHLAGFPARVCVDGSGV